MKKIFNAFFNMTIMAVLPGIAGAAGTYYNNSVYQRYGTNSNYNTAMSGRSYASKYGQQNTNTTTSTTTTRTVTRQSVNKSMATNNGAKKTGFVGNLGLSHEFANWNFEMNSAGSKLHYDNLQWNVLSGDVSYYFGDSVPMQVTVGARYGMQYGESSMIDDDISNGGYLVTAWKGDDTGGYIGYQTGHALSVGTSQSGTQMGFNAAFGLPDYFKWGNAKLTPSIGYRYLKYKLTTEKNYGVALDIFESTDAHPFVTCISGYLGELQCDPYLLFYTDDGVTITGRTELSDGTISDLIQMPASTFGNISGVSTGGTYYYEQMGTSHEYTTTWAGPYIAMDAEYMINNKNSVSGSIELGLPVYSSEGNQPYRYDWAHPKSVEDEGSLGDAIHFGLAAMWKTMVSDSMMLTLGFTYDYYSVSKATAKTFLNTGYYTDLYNAYQNAYNKEGATDEDKAYYQEQMDDIDELRAMGWVLESSSEIESVYKSMGIRLGLDYKF